MLSKKIAQENQSPILMQFNKVISCRYYYNRNVVSPENFWQL